MSTTTTKRITKAGYYADIIALLSGETPANGSTVKDAIGFINHELELISKKNSSTSKKQTAIQQANDAYRALILDYLSTCADGVTCTDIIHNVPELALESNQKISALVRSLVIAGQVTKSKSKGKTYFALA